MLHESASLNCVCTPLLSHKFKLYLQGSFKIFVLFSLTLSLSKIGILAIGAP